MQMNASQTNNQNSIIKEHYNHMILEAGKIFWEGLCRSRYKGTLPVLRRD